MRAEGEKAHSNLLRFAEAIPTVIVDHHPLRTDEYDDHLVSSYSVFMNWKVWLPCF